MWFLSILIQQFNEKISKFLLKSLVLFRSLQIQFFIEFPGNFLRVELPSNNREFFVLKNREGIFSLVSFIPSQSPQLPFFFEMFIFLDVIFVESKFMNKVEILFLHHLQISLLKLHGKLTPLKKIAIHRIFRICHFQSDTFILVNCSFQIECHICQKNSQSLKSETSPQHWEVGVFFFLLQSCILNNSSNSTVVVCLLVVDVE